MDWGQRGNFRLCADAGAVSGSQGAIYTSLPSVTYLLSQWTCLSNDTCRCTVASLWWLGEEEAPFEAESEMVLFINVDLWYFGTCLDA